MSRIDVATERSLRHFLARRIALFDGEAVGKLLRRRSRELEQVTAERHERSILRYYYSGMAIQDLRMLTPGELLPYARHALFLREESPFCQELDDETFLDFVAQYRVNNEDIIFARDRFYEQFAAELSPLSPERAALRLNELAAAEGRYQSSDERTLAATAFQKRGVGRCGEESVFLAELCRSVGIPARQVYAPLWAHCDDNHAWVEVFVNGAWRYLGALEPEPLLDRGWFDAASSRTVLLQSRVGLWSAERGGDREISRHAALCLENRTPRYARTRELRFCFRLACGAAAPQTRVSLFLLNEGYFRPLSRDRAREDGTLTLRLGLGDVLLLAESAGEELSAAVVLTSERDGDIEIDLKNEDRRTALSRVLTPLRRWRAPAAGRQSLSLDADEKSLRQKMIETSSRLLQDKMLRFETQARQLLSRHLPDAERQNRMWRLFREAAGNAGELSRFLSLAEEKALFTEALAWLEQMPSKNLVDLDGENGFLDFYQRLSLLPFPRPPIKRIYEELGPQIGCETVKNWLPAATDWLRSQHLQQRQDKERQILELWRAILAEAAAAEASDDLRLHADIASLLRGPILPREREILFVALLRASGIAAIWDRGRRRARFRLDLDGDWYQLGEANQAAIVPLSGLARRPLCVLSPNDPESEVLRLVSLATLDEDVDTSVRRVKRPWPLDGGDDDSKAVRGCRLSGAAAAGDLLIASLRLPDGDSLLHIRPLALGHGSDAEIELAAFRLKAEDYLVNLPLPPIALREIEREPFLRALARADESEYPDCRRLAQEGKRECSDGGKSHERELGELIREKMAERMSEHPEERYLELYWLGGGFEPDDHLLRELLKREKQRDDSRSSPPIGIIVNDLNPAVAAKLADLLTAAADLFLLEALYADEWEQLARAAFLPSMQLPLSLLLRGDGRLAYAQSGYNAESLMLMRRAQA